MKCNKRKNNETKRKFCAIKWIFVVIIAGFIQILVYYGCRMTSPKMVHSIKDRIFDPYKREILFPFDNMLTANVLCDNIHYTHERDIKKEGLARSCYFKKNTMCYNIKYDTWIFTPYKDSKVYNNYDLLRYSRTKDFSYNGSKYKIPKYSIPLKYPDKTPKAYEKQPFFEFEMFDENKYAYHESSKTLYIRNLTILGVMTEHIHNIGHVWFGTYFNILKAVENWYETDNIYQNYTKPTILIFDSNKTYWDDTIGSIFFNIQTMKELKSYLIKNSYQYACFDKLIIGTSNNNALYGGLHMRQSLLKFMRSKILKHYNLNPYWHPTKISDINLLIILKTHSEWNHTNWPLNLHNDVPQWIHQYYINTTNPTINKLTIIDPIKVPLSTQIKHISESSIIICQMGGISFTNFLMPLNGIEIIISFWDEDRSPPYTHKTSNDIIPDNDWEVRSALTTQYTFHYNDLTYNSRIKYINKDLLFTIINASLNILYSNFEIKF